MDHRLLEECCDIEDGKALINNSIVEKALGAAGVPALISGGIDDPVDAWLAFSQDVFLTCSLAGFSERLSCSPFARGGLGGGQGKITAQWAASLLRLASNARISAYERSLRGSRDNFALTAKSAGAAPGCLRNVRASLGEGRLIFEEASGRDQRLFAALGVEPPNGAVPFPDDGWDDDGDGDGSGEYMPEL